jgi:hypothetical protein
VRRRVAVVGLAAAAAAVLTLIVTSFTPQQYRGTADVVVPLPSQFGSPIAAVGQSVSDFEGALRSDVVAARVARDVDVPRDEVASGLSSEQLASGTIVEVTYVADDPGIASSVAGTASREALVFLLEARLAPQAEELSLAQDAARRADDAYAAFIESEGLLNPAGYFRDQAGRLQRLQDQADAARTSGDDQTAEELEARIDARQRELTPLLLEYTTLTTARQQSQSRFAETKASFDVADAAVEAAKNDGNVEVLDAVPVSRVAQLLRRLLVAIVVATALAIASIVLLALLGLGEPEPAVGPHLSEGAPPPGPRVAAPRRSSERPERRSAGVADAGRVARRVAPEPVPTADGASTAPGPAATRPKRKRVGVAAKERTREAPAGDVAPPVPPSGDADQSVG